MTWTMLSETCFDASLAYAGITSKLEVTDWKTNTLLIGTTYTLRTLFLYFERKIPLSEALLPRTKLLSSTPNSNGNSQIKPHDIAQSIINTQDHESANLTLSLFETQGQRPTIAQWQSLIEQLQAHSTTETAPLITKLELAVAYHEPTTSVHSITNALLQVLL